MRLSRTKFATRWLAGQAATAALLFGLMGIVAFVGLLVGGVTVAAVAIAVGATSLFASGQMGLWLLKAWGARPLSGQEAPDLVALLEALSARAGIATPRLFWIPSALPNAMAIAGPQGPLLAVTDGLLRQLPRRELAGVLAHEIGHVANGDLTLLGFANGLANLLRVSGSLGSGLAIFGWILGSSPMLWVGSILVLAPLVATILLLALSRQREFAADLTAASLTGDPVGLASALRRIERPLRMWKRWVGLADREQLLYRSHPPTNERVRRLLSTIEAPRSAFRPVAGGWSRTPSARRG